MPVFGTLVPVHPTIAPGQPLSLTWAVCDPDRIAQSANYMLTVNGRLVFPLDTRPEDHAMAQIASVPGAGSSPPIDRSRLRDAGMTTAEIDALYRFGSTITVQMLGFYRRRDHERDLTLYTAPPAHIRVESGAAEPGVGLSFVDAMGTTITRGMWKEAYTLRVALNNHEADDIAVLVTVTETEVGGSGASTTFPPRSALLLPGAPTSLSFPVPAKDWSWIDTEQMTGPFSKSFTYAVSVVGADNFGNPIRHAPVTENLEVVVSDEKQAWGWFAMSNFWWGIVDEILAFVIPEGEWLEGAGGLHHVSAAAAEVLAEDPPDPDPKYAEPTKFTASELPHALAATAPHYAALARMAWELPQRRSHLYKVEAKILGAIEAKDEAAETKLVQQYIAELAAMGQCYRSLVAEARAAECELEDLGIGSKEHYAAASELLARIQLGECVAPQSKVWAEPSKHISAIARFAGGLRRMDPDDLDLHRILRRATVAMGRAVQGTIAQSMARYAGLRPDYFGLCSDGTEPSHDPRQIGHHGSPTHQSGRR